MVPQYYELARRPLLPLPHRARGRCGRGVWSRSVEKAGRRPTGRAREGRVNTPPVLDPAASKLDLVAAGFRLGVHGRDSGGTKSLVPLAGLDPGGVGSLVPLAGWSVPFTGWSAPFAGRLQGDARSLAAGGWTNLAAARSDVRAASPRTACARARAARVHAASRAVFLDATKVWPPVWVGAKRKAIAESAEGKGGTRSLKHEEDEGREEGKTEKRPSVARHQRKRHEGPSPSCLRALATSSLCSQQPAS